MHEYTTLNPHKPRYHSTLDMHLVRLDMKLWRWLNYISKLSIGCNCNHTVPQPSDVLLLGCEDKHWFEFIWQVKLSSSIILRIWMHIRWVYQIDFHGMMWVTVVVITNTGVWGWVLASILIWLLIIRDYNVDLHMNVLYVCKCVLI